MNQYKHRGVSSVTLTEAVPYLFFLHQLTFSFPVCFSFLPLSLSISPSLEMGILHSLLSRVFWVHLQPEPMILSMQPRVFPQRIATRSCWSCCSGLFSPCWKSSIDCFSALLAFRQHGLYRKGLCQELENVPNNGGKIP